MTIPPVERMEQALEVVRSLGLGIRRSSCAIICYWFRSLQE